MIFFIMLLSVAPAYAYAISDTVQIASEPDYPPYCFVDENGEAAGLRVNIKIGIWNRIKQDLAEGRIDALPLVGRTPEREDLYDFTMPYLSLHGAVFVRQGTRNINSLADLKDKKIAVMKGDNAEEFVRRENISDHITTTKTFNEAFKELSRGKQDAVITQRVMGIELLKTLGIRNIKALDFQLPKFRQDFCFAVQKGNQELLFRLNEGLSIIIANDTYEEIRYRWFGPEMRQSELIAYVIKYIVRILIPLLVVLSFAAVIFLRREVRRKTADLRKEVQNRSEITSTLKRSEEEIQLLLNSTAEGIYGIDTQGNCTFINQSALNILKYSGQEQVLGKNMHELIHHTKADGSRYEKKDCKVYRAFREGLRIHCDDEVLWRSDGTGFDAEYFSYPIVQHDKIIGSVVAFWDITERKETEKELIEIKNHLEALVEERTAELEKKVRRLDRSEKALLYMVEDLTDMQTQLEEERRKLLISNKELEEFSYSVSHDLRAPLRAIDGYSRFLLEDYADKLDEEGRRYIDVIRTNAGKMDRLIIDLLNLSRITLADINPSLVDMREIAQSVFNEITSDEQKKAFEISIEEMPMVECDITFIKHVWQNLISNAIKYSAKSQTRKIEIKATEHNNEIVFCIKDCGVGFDNRYMDKLFGVFQRLHGEEEFEGTGVGLAIVKNIVERHGGKVWAEGNINAGAAFYFSLPKE